jgi:hypothetical protein
MSAKGQSGKVIQDLRRSLGLNMELCDVILFGQPGDVHLAQVRLVQALAVLSERVQAARQMVEQSIAEMAHDDSDPF